MGCPLTTHALDTASGEPAAGLALTVYRLSKIGERPFVITEATCDSNGRVPDLIPDPPSQWELGDYRIRFFTREYFALKSVDCFYPYCDVTFTITNTSSHYHVPLLISPFGYSTYRGC